MAVGSKIYKDISAVAMGTIQTVWTPESGKRVRLQGMTLSGTGAASLLFEDNAASSAIKFRTPALVAATPYTLDLGGGFALSAADNVLKCTSSAASTITGTLWGEED